MQINWLILDFKEINNFNLYQLLKLRSKVFVVEQNCVYHDIDKKDHHSYHLMAYDNQILVAYLRIVHPGISYSEASIGRVLTKMSHRRRGISKKIIKSAIQKVKDLYNNSNIRISAQEYLIPFYTSLNFVALGEVYLEDDIPHIEMIYVN